MTRRDRRSEQVSAATAASDAARSEIIKRHARLQSNGRLQRCRVAEAVDRDPKVIYATEDDACACAEELAMARLGAMRAYRCPYSWRGHYHLTTR